MVNSFKNMQKTPNKVLLHSKPGGSMSGKTVKNFNWENYVNQNEWQSRIDNSFILIRKYISKRFGEEICHN